MSAKGPTSLQRERSFATSPSGSAAGVGRQALARSPRRFWKQLSRYVAKWSRYVSSRGTSSSSSASLSHRWRAHAARDGVGAFARASRAYNDGAPRASSARNSAASRTTVAETIDATTARSLVRSMAPRGVLLGSYVCCVLAQFFGNLPRPQVPTTRAGARRDVFSFRPYFYAEVH